MAPLTILLSLLGCSEMDLANGSYSSGDEATDQAVAPNEYGDEGDTASSDDDECLAVSSEPVDVYMSADDSNSQAQPVLVRHMIEEGQSFGGAPRLYEFLNYYGFDLEAPALGDVAIEPQLRYDDEAETYSMLIAVVGHEIAAEDRRPVNLTFSVDTSGSMGGHPLDRAKDVLYAAASNMMEGDIVSIVTWNEDASVLLESVEVAGPNDARFVQAVDRMQSGGSTNLAKGLKTAYGLAENSFSEDRINRVVLLSDGGANTGVTDDELIAQHAEDGNGEGIYMLGVGASEPYGYSDHLMDTVTDLGKGAYLYIDTAEEARAMFTGDRFVTNTEIAARDVQLRVTLPGGYLISEFHGEELSLDPSEVEPQHLAPNDAMLYHQELTDCDADLHDGSEVFTFHVTWTDPETREVKETELAYSVDEMLGRDKAALLKADAIVAYAQAIFSGKEGEATDALELIGKALDAAPQDEDLQEIDQLLRTWRAAQ